MRTSRTFLGDMCSSLDPAFCSSTVVRGSGFLQRARFNPRQISAQSHPDKTERVQGRTTS